MEVFSIFFHKYVLHGPLWSVHKTHHKPDRSPWELNDLVSVFFGLVSVACIVWGAQLAYYSLSSFGLGIAWYGLLYFLLHDLIVHRRFNSKWSRPRNRYLAALRRAHMQHHKYVERTPGESYGLFVFPKRFYTELKK